MGRKRTKDAAPIEQMNFAEVLQKQYNFPEKIVALFKELETAHGKVAEKLYGNPEQSTLETGSVAGALVMGKFMFGQSDDALAEWLKQEIERMNTFLPEKGG